MKKRGEPRAARVVHAGDGLAVQRGGVDRDGGLVAAARGCVGLDAVR